MRFETLSAFTRNSVKRVSSNLVAHRLFVCLDAALSDEAKVRLEDGRRVKVI